VSNDGCVSARVNIHATMPLTAKEVNDAMAVAPLLEQIDEPIAAFLGNGAYDRESVTATLTQRHPQAAIIVPPRKDAVLSEQSQTNPTQRDRRLLESAKRGRLGWQKHSGYTIRSRVENAIGRFKQVLGEALRSQTDENQVTEIHFHIDI